MDQPEEIFFDTTCPHCRRTLSFPEGAAGTVQDCPMCGEIVVVSRDKTPLAGKLPLPIITSRLRLRPPVVADAPKLEAFMCDPAVFRYWDMEPTAPEDIEPAIAKPWSNRLTQEAGTICLAIETADRVIGLAWFNYAGTERTQGAIYAVIHPEFQRRGYGSEAARALLGFCFTGINLRRVMAACDSRNEAACRMLEKTGMRREGELVQGTLLRGELVNTVLYAMLAPEFHRPLPRHAHAEPAPPAEYSSK